MPKFKCRVIEEVKCYVEIEVEARSKKAAAQLARDMWVNDGLGEKYEEVDERWVEIEGERVETKGD